MMHYRVIINDECSPVEVAVVPLSPSQDVKLYTDYKGMYSFPTNERSILDFAEWTLFELKYVQVKPPLRRQDLESDWPKSSIEISNPQRGVFVVLIEDVEE